jgi:hypothetical protein
MRLSVVLLVLALAGVVGGAWLIGRWAVGLAIIADSVAVAAWALLHDDGTGPLRNSSVHEVRTVEDVLERARRSG